MSLPQNQDPIKTTLSSPDDTTADHRCAVLTGAGRSAVAVVGARGSNIDTAIQECFDPRTPGPFQSGEIRFGQWDGEAVVVMQTDRETFEIHCHGGPLAASRITEDLHRLGVSRVEPNDWHGDDLPLPIREAHQVLAQCLTTRTAAIALDQFRGAMRNWCQNLINDLVKLDDTDSITLLKRPVAKVAGRGSWGTRIAEPFRVVLVGPPNVGKSSLVNAIVGYDRSITMDVAGTTRDVLHADTVIDGVPIRLSDTAGLRESSDSIESQGVDLAKRAADAADLVVVVSDPDHFFDAETDFGKDTVYGKETCFDPSVVVLNKADLLDGQTQVTKDVIRTTATTGEGVPALMTAIAEKIAAPFCSSGEPVPLTDRQVQCLHQVCNANTKQEMIDGFKELIGS